MDMKMVMCMQQVLTVTFSNLYERACVACIFGSTCIGAFMIYTTEQRRQQNLKEFTSIGASSPSFKLSSLVKKDGSSQVKDHRGVFSGRTCNQFNSI